MDFLASKVRGGIASARGARRVLRRTFLETVYAIKERWFRLCDSVVEQLNCERRRHLHWRKECCRTSFCHDSSAIDSVRSSALPAHYDFTELQHGPNSESQ
eukprot:gb/GFBE01046782.1/.p1 GENE.gb/GFBE01046782.1/~~gb/GFBE01046782.1/.p1  ORF type:complete len:101 (+),score=10.49 gb/GFBE01046782.1/:1-303(+)